MRLLRLNETLAIDHPVGHEGLAERLPQRAPRLTACALALHAQSGASRELVAVDGEHLCVAKFAGELGYSTSDPGGEPNRLMRKITMAQIRHSRAPGLPATY